MRRRVVPLVRHSLATKSTLKRPFRSRLRTLALLLHESIEVGLGVFRYFEILLKSFFERQFSREAIGVVQLKDDFAGQFFISQAIEFLEAFAEGLRKTFSSLTRISM